MMAWMVTIVSVSRCQERDTDVILVGVLLGKFSSKKEATDSTNIIFHDFLATDIRRLWQSISACNQSVFRTRHGYAPPNTKAILCPTKKLTHT